MVTLALDTPTSDETRMRELLARVAAGDQEAFAEVYDCTSPEVFGVILGIVRDQGTAGTVLSDTYLAVWKTAVVGASRSEDVRAWIAGIARARAIASAAS